MADNAPPSIDPADLGSLTGMIRAILRKNGMQQEDMLPAIVIAYDRASNRATVKPIVQMVDTNGNSIGRAGVASVPVYQFGAGGFMMSFPVKPGDLGWIKANDRDISLCMQSYSETKPNTQRLHSFQDSMFFPDVLTGFTINGEDTDNAVLQNLSGTVRLALASDKIKITVGAVSLAVSASGVDITGGYVRHNGVNIGATHRHSQGNDGAGDAEQDTEVPH